MNTGEQQIKRKNFSLKFKIPEIKYHEQILFVIVFGIIIYGSCHYSYNSVQNYKEGLIAALLVIIFEGTLKNYRGPFILPNIAFWRCVHRIALVYLVILVFLVFQNERDARQLMVNLYPQLGQPVTSELHTYDDNCEFHFKNIWDNIDHYYFVHCANWFLATLIVRDPYILHMWSIFDEIIELSWQHILPHFRECWWDHLFLDVLLSNTPAIIFGMWFLKINGFKTYDWLGRKDKKSFWDWEFLKCHRRFGGLCAIILVINLNFLTGFFLINGLWIPPQNNLNKYRLLVWFGMANLAFKEIYTDIETWGSDLRRKQPITGKMRWICSAVTFLEVACSIKFVKGSGNLLFEPTPIYIWLPWLTFILIMVLFYLYLRLNKMHTVKYGKKRILSESEDDHRYKTD